MTDFRNKILLHYRWPVIIAVVLTALAVFQLVRVNAPRQEQSVDESFHATSGTVMDGNYTVPADQFLAVRMDFNHRVKLTGWFRTQSLKMLLACLVVDAENFERWKSGSEYKRLAETNVIPGGKINLVIDPGTYYLILDNRRSANDQPVEAHFDVD
jgi:hypothetical protein